MPEHIRKLLLESGACAVGFAEAGRVDDKVWREFLKWLDSGMNAGMAYMRNYPEIRRDPRLLLEGAKTVISLAFNYRQPNPCPAIATYALGKDYHNVLRKRLKKVVTRLKQEYGAEWRICIDSAPILERYWAEKAGIGFRSPMHGNIVVPGVGSMVFLAEIITTMPIQADNPIQIPCLPEDEEPSSAVCPTGALKANGMVDARLCINYLTIEHKGDWDEIQREIMRRPGARDKIFGCDICQRGCSYNLHGSPSLLDEFRQNSLIPSVISAVSDSDQSLLDGLDLDGSPLKRAGKESLLRKR